MKRFALVVLVLLAACSSQSARTTWTPSEVIDAFNEAGLEAESPEVMSHEDCIPCARISEEADFQISSLNSVGSVMSFADKEDLEWVKAYYTQLGESSPLLYGWLFTQGNILVRLNGNLPKQAASKYEAVLLEMSRSPGTPRPTWTPTPAMTPTSTPAPTPVPAIVPAGWRSYQTLSGNMTFASPGSWKVQSETVDGVTLTFGATVVSIKYMGTSGGPFSDDEQAMSFLLATTAQGYEDSLSVTNFKVVDRGGVWDVGVGRAYYCETLWYLTQIGSDDTPVSERTVMLLLGDEQTQVALSYANVGISWLTDQDRDTFRVLVGTVRVH